MQTLDARHWELFLNKEYKDREWKYEQVCMRVVAGHCSEAAACIFDAKQLRSKGTHGTNPTFHPSTLRAVDFNVNLLTPDCFIIK